MDYIPLRHLLLDHVSKPHLVINVVDKQELGNGSSACSNKILTIAYRVFLLATTEVVRKGILSNPSLAGLWPHPGTPLAFILLLWPHLFVPSGYYGELPMFSNSASPSLSCCIHRLSFHPYWTSSPPLLSKKK